MLMLFLRFKKVPVLLLKSREPQTHKSKVITLLILIEKYDSYILHNWIAGGPNLPNRVELNFGKNQTQKRSRPLISWPISDSAINSNSLFSSNFILAVQPWPQKEFRCSNESIHAIPHKFTKDVFVEFFFLLWSTFADKAL